MTAKELIQLLTDTENQPHQFVGDPDGLRRLFDQRSASNGKSGLMRVAPAGASEKMRAKTSRAFGALLRRARTAAGLTLPSLAAKARLPKSLISTIENGKGNPSLSTLRKLSRAIGVQITINE